MRPVLRTGFPAPRVIAMRHGLPGPAFAGMFLVRHVGDTLARGRRCPAGAILLWRL